MTAGYSRSSSPATRARRARLHDLHFLQQAPGRVHEAVYREKYPQSRQPQADGMRPDHDEKFTAPPGFDAHRINTIFFYDAVRSRKRLPSGEDAVFGLRAAGPALLGNVSYFERKACHWDPAAMQTI